MRTSKDFHQFFHLSLVLQLHYMYIRAALMSTFECAFSRLTCFSPSFFINGLQTFFPPFFLSTGEEREQTASQIDSFKVLNCSCIFFFLVFFLLANGASILSAAGISALLMMEEVLQRGIIVRRTKQSTHASVSGTCNVFRTFSALPALEERTCIVFTDDGAL